MSAFQNVFVPKKRTLGNKKCQFADVKSLIENVSRFFLFNYIQLMNSDLVQKGGFGKLNFFGFSLYPIPYRLSQLQPVTYYTLYKGSNLFMSPYFNICVYIFAKFVLDQRHASWVCIPPPLSLPLSLSLTTQSLDELN